MQEIIGNIWETDCDIICVTTNGVVKSNGELVMGKGVALQAKQRYPILAKRLGNMVSLYENKPYLIVYDNIKYDIISLPTKYHWRDKSDIELIKNSLIIIKNMISEDHTIALSRPGCGNGGLKWEDVKKVIEPILDDRFTVYSLKE